MITSAHLFCPDSSEPSSLTERSSEDQWLGSVNDNFLLQSSHIKKLTVIRSKLLGDQLIFRFD